MILLTKKDYDHKQGGVPVHSEYLKQTFPDLRHYTVDSFGIPEQQLSDMVYELCTQVTPHIKDNELVITDGFWAAYVPNRDRIISVCHGTLAGVAHIGHPLAKLQAQAMKGTHVVAVSRSACYECQKFYGITPEETIINGVELDVFKPAANPTNKKHCTIGVIHNKGKRSKSQWLLKLLEKNFNLHYISGSRPDDIVAGLQACSIYLHLSDYEGCSYAVCEAMACGLPVVGTQVGLFANYYKWFVNDYGMSVGEMVTVADEFEVTNAIYKVMNNYEAYKPREFCDKFSNLELFKREWKDYVNQIAKSGNWC